MTKLLSNSAVASTPVLPPVLSGFEKVRRYYERDEDRFVAAVAPGEFYVTSHQETISTVLGSCVAACIRDPVTQIGGMNHFMLPCNDMQDESWNASISAANRYGSYAMESLINSLIKHGAARRRLEVKLFGGGHILDINVDVGEKNIEFALSYLAREGLLVKAQDLGGLHARQLLYRPFDGVARVRKLERTQVASIKAVEERLLKRVVQQPNGGRIDLF